jgi:hypothetical protein
MKIEIRKGPGCGECPQERRELSASDFPGIDEAKFNEWKALGLRNKRRARIAAWASLPIAFILRLIARSREWTWQGWDVDWLQVYLLLCIAVFVFVYGAYFDITTRGFRRLGKELKMSARLKAKKKGRAFTG